MLSTNGVRYLCVIISISKIIYVHRFLYYDGETLDTYFVKKTTYCDNMN